MGKKIVSWISAAALFITLMCTAFVNVSAAGEVKVAAATDLTTVKQGGTVCVDLNLTENPGLVSIHLKVNYDTDVFEFTSFEDKMLFGPKATLFDQDGDGYYAMNWADYSTKVNHTTTGTLASVYFKVKNTAENGNYEFNITAVEDDVMDYDLNQLPISLESASVKVSDGKSDDATLKSLTVSKGTLDPEFSADVENYTVVLPYGSTVPKVTAVKNDAKATINIVQATGFESGKNAATVTVTAEKGNTKTYTVTFTEINAVLSSLKVNGTSVTGFNSNTTTYTYDVSYTDWKDDPDKTYEIEAAPSKETSTVSIEENNFALTSTDPDKNSEKSVKITVTSEQGDTTDYTIKFVVLACQHDYVIDEAQSTSADCTTEGENVYVCSVCGKDKTETVAALGHDKNSEWTVVDATCETDGSRTQLCSRCGEKIDEKVIPKKGHKWSAWTNVEGTGDYARTCSNCNTTQTRTVSVAEDGHAHDFNSPSCQREILKQATCAETGIRRVWCSNEQCAEFLDEDIDKTSHTPVSSTLEATCTEPGLTTVICSTCGEELERTAIDPLGHDYGAAWESDETGHWHSCTRCGTAGDKESHSENGGVVTTPATSYSDGVMTYSCSICGREMRTEIIPATGDSSSYNPIGGGYVGGPVIPFGGITESVTLKVENKLTGKTSTARAQKNGNTITANLGRDNDGYYANIYTTDDEYVYSALIENGKAKFNISDGVNVKIVIDSIAYGEDVSSAAAVSTDETEISFGGTMIRLTIFTLLSGIAVAAVLIKKRAK